MVLTSPLLETKLRIPRTRPLLVERPRLIRQLDRGLESRLTLLSAPAGFGKSTVIASWLAAAHRDRAAWYSIDHGDNEPATFWTYLITALRNVAPQVGEGSLPLLDPPQPRVDVALAKLINELDALHSDVVLVLDDYHAIESPDIHEAMAHLLDHLPAPMHLVIATRADPPLPLARLRARRELVEIRAADLRFTPDEAADYFRQVVGLELGAPQVAALEGRTEGWIAALQLAGLSMQGRDDVAEFIAGFAGDDRYIVDYLVEEVLRQQTDAVRGFLLQTSILSRMTGSLCDAVTGLGGGRATLEELDRANLFLVPLDDRREWYRYHHLFADVLHARLLDERPNEVPELHRRAGEWHERSGEKSQAVRHALAGKDFERAADLVELATGEISRHRQEALRRTWLEALPPAVVRRRPVLSNLFAGTLMQHGETDRVDDFLRDAERWLEPTSGEPDYANEDAFRDLPASIAVHRAGLARLTGDVAGTIRHASAALDLIRDDDDLGRGAASALLGLAQWTNGDVDAAYRGYITAMTHLEKAGYLSDVLGCSIAVADMLSTQGKLAEALRAYERGLRLATGSGSVILRGAADMHTGIADILRERNDLEGAMDHLASGAALGEENGLPQNPYRSRLVMARIRQATGDLDAAAQLFDEAQRVYFTDFSPSVRPPSALKARMRIVQGALAEAAGWALDEGLSADDALSYVREFEHATLARLLVAQERVAEAQSLLDRLLRAADEGDRTGSVIDILVAQAIASAVAGDVAAAMAALERALALAQPEGYVRAFLDEGPPMVSLLKRAVKGGVAADAVGALLAASGAPAKAAMGQPLVEPLSERELEVLRFLEGDLDGPGIANELIVSLNTVRTHTKNIYAKLGVNSRRAAVRRAAELGLLSGAGSRRPTE